jgi:hypothetical protein
MEIVPDHVGLGLAAHSTPYLSIPQMSELHLDVHPMRPVLHLDAVGQQEPELLTPHLTYGTYSTGTYQGVG